MSFTFDSRPSKIEKKNKPRQRNKSHAVWMDRYMTGHILLVFRNILCPINKWVREKNALESICQDCSDLWAKGLSGFLEDVSFVLFAYLSLWFRRVPMYLVMDFRLKSKALSTLEYIFIGWSMAILSLMFTMKFASLSPGNKTIHILGYLVDNSISFFFFNKAARRYVSW